MPAVPYLLSAQGRDKALVPEHSYVRALNSQDTHDLLTQELWQLDWLICPTKIISS